MCVPLLILPSLVLSSTTNQGKTLSFKTLETKATSRRTRTPRTELLTFFVLLFSRFSCFLAVSGLRYRGKKEQRLGIKRLE